ncbi:MAG: radical SAM protein [Symploca sp. SIO1B1]|nr:radical SAM protein [Symploca sp. SIO1B1]
MLHIEEIKHAPAKFESFIYPFFDFNYQVPASEIALLFLQNPAKKKRGEDGLYIHIPFCDTICGFCPFVKSVGSDERVTAYLEALLREIELTSQLVHFQDRLFSSVYFGGGTPSILSVEQLEKLTLKLRSSFLFSNDCEWSLEVEAKSMTLDKIIAAKELGFSRVSFGVQTLNHKYREMVNLTTSLDQIFSLVENLCKHIPNNNFDLLVGFPGQTIDEALKDVEYAANTGIASISIYPLDYCMILPSIHDKIRKGSLPALSSLSCRFDMFYQCRKLLQNFFQEFNIYCYGNQYAKPCQFMFNIVYGSFFNEYVGLGCSSYSCLRGLMYQNEPSESEYIRLIGAGILPVKVASCFQAYEKGLVFFPKLMRFSIDEYFQLQLDISHGKRMSTLIKNGYITKNDTSFLLTELGEKHYAAIMVYLFSNSQFRLYTKICEKLKANGLLDYGESLVKTRTYQYGVLTAMT